MSAVPDELAAMTPVRVQPAAADLDDSLESEGVLAGVTPRPPSPLRTVTPALMSPRRQAGDTPAPVAAADSAAAAAMGAASAVSAAAVVAEAEVDVGIPGADLTLTVLLVIVHALQRADGATADALAAFVHSGAFVRVAFGGGECG
jgi:hypothetical protein